MLTVACLLVKGNVAFTTDYVIRLRSMVARTLRQPHRFVCFTDRPDPLRNLVDTITIRPPPPGRFGWWSKIELFNSKHGLKGRVLYLDLDVLLVRSLNGIVSQEAPFSLVPHYGEFPGRGRQITIHRYNSSCMVFDVSDRLALLYDRWTPEVAQRLWGDQDWIAENFPHEHRMPIEWFPRLSDPPMVPIIGSAANGRAAPSWPREARVVLCKRPKNHIALKDWPWFDQSWR
jgi:hypothetical protein